MSKKSIIYTSQKEYLELYNYSINNPEEFWREQAPMLSWDKDFTKVLSGQVSKGNIKWFEDGKLNVCYNCVDRHLKKNGNKTAIIWEGDDPKDSLKLTFSELHKEVCKFSNMLKNRKIKKGDRVCIYMPMIPEAAIAMLACARIGAIHNVVFGGFSPESIKTRILDADCCAVITADGGTRGGKLIRFKDNVDQALTDCPNVHTVITIKHANNNIQWIANRDIDYLCEKDTLKDDCPYEIMNAEDPLFILYTSGSTGTPKGVLHTTAGYLLYASFTHKFTFNIHESDIYWCTADVGWITGHSYIVYGPLANATTTVMFEGVPSSPDASRCWKIVDKYKINVFYTAPTLIRALRKDGDDNVTSTSRKSLKVLGTVGEPINPESWKWYFEVVGEKRCPIMDTWWQTETGGFMIIPPLDKKLQKPGFAQQPMLGIKMALLDNNGDEIKGEGAGLLTIANPWPGMMRGIFNNHKRFIDTYLKPFPGYYLTGDGAMRDADGDYRITGRVDDTINVSGHLLGTAEIESALVLHDKIAEAAVVGFAHQLKGKALYAFVTPMKGVDINDENLNKELKALVRSQVGPVASIDKIQYAQQLPKTRSGKIMRRILRKIANNDLDSFGDISTLHNPDCISILIKNRIK